jgi:hypothetical protein
MIRGIPTVATRKWTFTFWKLISKKMRRRTPQAIRSHCLGPRLPRPESTGPTCPNQSVHQMVAPAGAPCSSRSSSSIASCALCLRRKDALPSFQSGFA